MFSLSKGRKIGLGADAQSPTAATRRRNMRTLINALIRERKNAGLLVAALLTAGAIGGWAISTTFVSNASAFVQEKTLPLNEAKLRLVGSYVVTGTDPEGKPYVGTSRLGIALAPSGALELDWDDGQTVGVGQLMGDALAVASTTRGRAVIMIMNINSDGSLSGQSFRRTDRGYKGSETWRKT
jgi:hypothetical protein